MVKFNIKTTPLTTDKIFCVIQTLGLYGDVSQLDEIIYSEENHLAHTIYFPLLRWLKKYNNLKALT